MYSELMSKFLETSEDILGIFIVDREKEVPIEYSLKKQMNLNEVEEISRAVSKSLKAYEATKSKSDLITIIFNTNDFSIIADDYQDNNRILVILFKPNYFIVKFVGKNAEYLGKIIDKIKSENK
ncbi:MAG: hypothetical protein RMJ36_03125 [Candidatus Calescibacterium sp.]|nr:hypothetical protein [Candidatus Calescibacterium sp.]MDW8132629.1 hypothetical protein [Candidatus Calescibacterium sp.]